MNNLRKIIGLGLLLLITVQESITQDRFTFPETSDIGLNITNVLSSFIGNTNTDFVDGSFPFVAKINRKNHAVRIGLGFNIRNSDETLVDIEQFLFNNYQLTARVGYERKKYLGNRFGFYYGLDMISSLINEESTFSNTVDITKISENTVGIGGGPVYGFEYYINKFMYVGTEGSFYGIYNIKTRKETFAFNPEINSESKSTGFQAKITVPVHLYVMVRF